MILSDIDIEKRINAKLITIAPFDKGCLGTNSYDVHLSKHLATYNDKILDAKKHNKVTHFEIPEEGFVLKPGTLYLGSTQEITDVRDTVPFLEGKSSVGRLGIDIHATAGKGDVGFNSNWTLELSATMPVRVYTGMPIGQLIFYLTSSPPRTLYDKKKNAKYSHQGHRPKESMMFKNIF